MQLLNIIQNTPEWYAMRRTKIGASDCAGILCKNPYSSPYRVWRQKIFGDEEFINGDMQRGIKLEEKAREWISEKHGIRYQTQCGQSEKRDWQIASLDCFFRDNQSTFAGEIKSPRKNKFNQIKKEGLPEYWQWQIQHQLSVTGLERMFCLIYIEEDQHLIWINRDKEKIDMLNQIEEYFYYEYMLKFVSPPLTEREESHNEMIFSVFSK